MAVSGLGPELLIIGLMIVFNAFFAAYEIALASISLGRLEALERMGKRGARAALAMRRDVEASLAAIQLGITLVGAIAAAVGGVGGVESLEPFFAQTLGLGSQMARVLALALVVAPLTFVTIVFGELVPKLFGLRNKEWLVLRLSPVMYAFTLSVWPVVRVLEATAEGTVAVAARLWRPRRTGEARAEAAILQELRALAADARMARLIGRREERIILGASRLAHRPVREIMISVEHMVTLPVDISPSEALAKAHQDMHTRYPVTEEPANPQSVIGYVNFKDIILLLRSYPHETTLRSIVRPLPSFPHELSLSLCLERMIRQRAHIALIRDAAGAVVGMITLEDIVEELVGEIEDEFDRVPEKIVEAATGWLVGGGTPLELLKRRCGVDLLAGGPVQAEVVTLDDWVEQRLGRAPRGGDVVRWGPHEIRIRKVRRQKVLEAHIITRPGHSASSPAGDEPQAASTS